MFYKEPDTELMLDYAAKGLMAGLDDPYSFYYTSEEFEKMLEDDTGEYVGIGVSILSNNATGLCIISRGPGGKTPCRPGSRQDRINYQIPVFWALTIIRKNAQKGA